MRRTLSILAVVVAALALQAEPVCVDGVCYPSEEAAREAGVVVPFGAGRHEAPQESAVHTEGAAEADGRRLAMGYMSPSELIAFLRNEPPPDGRLEDHALWLIILLVLVGGLAANLTPCVLPLVPINLILIGKGWRRGAAYAAGITTAYGVLGLAAAFGGLAFGTLQSSPWFNAGVAVVFTVLALAMLDLVHLPELKALKGFFKGRRSSGSGSSSGSSGASGAKGFMGLKAYMLGLGAATLAGACVEPILIATLLLTAKWFAAGRMWSVVLPFVLGAGMGLPYPFAAAGLSVLPKPGAWMVWVKRAFALVFVVMACWYGWQVVGRIENGKLKMGNEERPEGLAGGGAAASRPIFVKVGAPWCRNCASMARTTFKDPAVVHELSAYEVREIEIDSFADLARYPELKGLDIKGVPAYVVLREGEKVGR